MTALVGAMHVARNKRRYLTKSGEEKTYESVLLRRTYREGGKVKHETLANLKALPDDAVAAVEATLKGRQLVAAGTEFSIARSLPHGHVAAVTAMAHQLGFPGLLGPSCRSRDLVLALIVSRVVRPASKLATAAWWPDVTLGVDLGVAGATTDGIYAAMDWLVDRQDSIEKQLAARHLSESANPGRMALFDLTSAWVTGRCCELAARGYSRDGKKGCEQIEYGILTDPAGRPVAVRVFAGNTADPTAFTEIAPVVRDTFGLDKLVLVGDRGMITTARIAALRELNDDPDTATDFGWITALRAPEIAKLARDDGPLQMSLFDQQDLAEITHPDYPGERLIACRNPALAAEAALDGIYVLRTSVTDDELDAASVVAGYKNLANVERDFRILKADDLDLRPIHHRLDDRVRAHVLICLLACYLVWHLRKAWAPLTFTDEAPPTRDNPVAPAQRSTAAHAKAATQHDSAGNPLRSFRGLLDHLATLTRNQVHYHHTRIEIPILADPTDDQRRAFSLIGAPIPLTSA